MKLESQKPAMLTLALVLFGFSLGIFTDRLYLFYQNKKYTKVTKVIQQGIPTLENLVWYFSKHLKLSASQKQQAKRLLRQHITRGLRFFRDRPPEVSRYLQKGLKIRARFQGSMRKILTSAQQKQYDQMIKRMNRHRILNQLRRLQFRHKVLQKKK